MNQHPAQRSPTPETGEMSFVKPPSEMVDAFAAAAGALPGVESRNVFGSPCAFFRGNMFAGLHAGYVFFRLAPEDRSEFLALPGTAVFEPVAGRPMREYVRASPEMSAAHQEWPGWLNRALEYARSLPVVEAKPRKKRKAA